MSNETTTAAGGVRKKGKLGQHIAYACGNSVRPPSTTR